MHHKAFSLAVEPAHSAPQAPSWIIIGGGPRREGREGKGEGREGEESSTLSDRRHC